MQRFYKGFFVSNTPSTSKTVGSLITSKVTSHQKLILKLHTFPKIYTIALSPLHCMVQKYSSWNKPNLLFNRKDKSRSKKLKFFFSGIKTLFYTGRTSRGWTRNWRGHDSNYDQLKMRIGMTYFWKQIIFWVYSRNNDQKTRIRGFTTLKMWS